MVKNNLAYADTDVILRIQRLVADPTLMKVTFVVEDRKCGRLSYTKFYVDWSNHLLTQVRNQKICHILKFDIPWWSYLAMSKSDHITKTKLHNYAHEIFKMSSELLLGFTEICLVYRNLLVLRVLCEPWMSYDVIPVEILCHNLCNRTFQLVVLNFHFQPVIICCDFAVRNTDHNICGEGATRDRWQRLRALTLLQCSSDGPCCS